jgi:hypothetical protein
VVLRGQPCLRPQCTRKGCAVPCVHFTMHWLLVYKLLSSLMVCYWTPIFTIMHTRACPGPLWPCGSVVAAVLRSCVLSSCCLLVCLIFFEQAGMERSFCRVKADRVYVYMSAQLWVDGTPLHDSISVDGDVMRSVYRSTQVTRLTPLYSPIQASNFASRYCS